jgi:phage/plasmid-associated DNA primase
MENLFIATGVGGNGKSLEHELMNSMLGDYGFVLQAVALTKPILSGPNPEIAGMHKKRFVLTSEPDKASSICTSTMKAITGNTTLPVRGMYETKVGITLCNTSVLECNEMLKLDAVTNAELRRLIAFKFNTVFVEKHVYDAKEKKRGFGIINPDYKTDAFKHTHRQALFEILIPYWLAYYENGRKLPETPSGVQKMTIEYMKDSDRVYPFFRQKYIKTSNEADYVFCLDVLEEYKSSTIYNNMSKKERRECTQNSFYEKLRTDLFLREFFRDRKTYKMSDGTRNTKPLLVGWRLRKDDEADVQEDDEQEDDEQEDDEQEDEGQGDGAALDEEQEQEDEEQGGGAALDEDGQQDAPLVPQAEPIVASPAEVTSTPSQPSVSMSVPPIGIKKRAAINAFDAITTPPSKSPRPDEEDDDDAVDEVRIEVDGKTYVADSNNAPFYLEDVDGFQFGPIGQLVDGVPVFNEKAK